MKLLSRLREPDPARLAVVSWNDEADHASFEHDVAHLGIGAAMAQDVVGMEFLDGCRRRIPSIHEEFPPHALGHDDLTEALES